jgi:hypothetical protein
LLVCPTDSLRAGFPQIFCTVYRESPMETLSAPQRKIVSSAMAGLTPTAANASAERENTAAAKTKRSMGSLL